jgi:hypothetical protein
VSRKELFRASNIFVNHHPYQRKDHLICIMSFLARVAPRLANTARIGSNSRIASLPRSFTTSVRILSDAPPVIQGEGGKVGEVATDEEQSTGLERFELLGRLQGKDVFDLEPLDASRLGTKKEPVLIQSLVSAIVDERATSTWAFCKRQHQASPCFVALDGSLG